MAVRPRNSHDQDTERGERLREADHVQHDPARNQEVPPMDLFPNDFDEDDEETQEYVDLDAENLHDHGY